MLVFVLDVEMSDVDGLVVSEVREDGKLDDKLDRLEVTFETVLETDFDVVLACLLEVS